MTYSEKFAYFLEVPDAEQVRFSSQIRLSGYNSFLLTQAFVSDLQLTLFPLVCLF